MEIDKGEFEGFLAWLENLPRRPYFPPYLLSEVNNIVDCIRQSVNKDLAGKMEITCDCQTELDLNELEKEKGFTKSETPCPFCNLIWILRLTKKS